MTPIIAITPGEPAGIGPDLAIINAQEDIDAHLIYFADPDMLDTRALELNIEINIQCLSSLDNIPSAKKNTMLVLPVKLSTPCEAGKLNPDNAQYILDCIRLAVESQLNNKTHARGFA